MQKFVLVFFVLSSMTACSSWTARRAPNQETKVVLKDAHGNVKEASDSAAVRDGKEVTPIPVSEDSAEAQTAKAEVAGAAETESTESAQQQATEMKEAVAAAAQHVQDTHGKSKREAGPVPAEKALGWLKNGNTRFVKGTFRKDGATSADRMRILASQKPHSVILASSDSRTPPEVIFDQKLGEIYVVRTFGQAPGADVIASLEYAVQYLGTNLIVFMGNDSNSAVQAAVSGLDLGSPAMNAAANNIKPRIKDALTGKPSTGVIEESWANLNGLTRDLTERSAILRDALASGEVKLQKAMYHLDSGRVEWR